MSRAENSSCKLLKKILSICNQPKFYADPVNLDFRFLTLEMSKAPLDKTSVSCKCKRVLDLRPVGSKLHNFIDGLHLNISGLVNLAFKFPEFDIFKGLQEMTGEGRYRKPTKRPIHLDFGVSVLQLSTPSFSNCKLGL